MYILYILRNALHLGPEESQSESEERQVAQGETSSNKIVVVIHVELVEGDLFRIISARKASEGEELIYWRKRV